MIVLVLHIKYLLASEIENVYANYVTDAGTQYYAKMVLMIEINLSHRDTYNMIRNILSHTNLTNNLKAVTDCNGEFPPKEKLLHLNFNGKFS